MDLVERIGAIRNQLNGLKTAQETSGDSALWYSKEAYFGLKLDSTTHLYKAHFITGHEQQNCVFMPQITMNMGTTYYAYDQNPLVDWGDDFYWSMDGVNEDAYYNSDMRYFTSDRMYFFSNVDFELNVSEV